MVRVSVVLVLMFLSVDTSFAQLNQANQLSQARPVWSRLAQMFPKQRDALAVPQRVQTAIEQTAPPPPEKKPVREQSITCVFDANGVCSCPPEYVVVDGMCHLCPENSGVIGSQSEGWKSCACTDGYRGLVTDSLSVCNPCPSNTFGRQGSCFPCPANTTSLSGQSTCSCPSNSFYSSIDTPSCLPCPLNSVAVSGATSVTDCKCNPGTTFVILNNSSGVCLDVSAPFSVRPTRLLSNLLASGTRATAYCKNSDTKCYGVNKTRLSFRWIQVMTSMMVSMYSLVDSAAGKCPSQKEFASSLLGSTLTVFDLSIDVLNSPLDATAMQGMLIFNTGLAILYDLLRLIFKEKSATRIELINISADGLNFDDKKDHGVAMRVQENEARANQLPGSGEHVQVMGLVGDSIQRNAHRLLMYGLVQDCTDEVKKTKSEAKGTYICAVPVSTCKKRDRTVEYIVSKIVERFLAGNPDLNVATTQHINYIPVDGPGTAIARYLPFVLSLGCGVVVIVMAHKPTVVASVLFIYSALTVLFNQFWYSFSEPLVMSVAMFVATSVVCLVISQGVKKNGVFMALVVLMLNSTLPSLSLAVRARECGDSHSDFLFTFLGGALSAATLLSYVAYKVFPELKEND